jgi:hypothetical protein
MSVQGKRITCKAVTFLMGCRNKFGMTDGFLIFRTPMVTTPTKAGTQSTYSTQSTQSTYYALVGVVTNKPFN